MALYVAVFAALGASRLATESSATSRVAVSDEDEWPFYTTARDALLETALDPDVQDDVRRGLGVDDTALELQAALTGGEISVDLTARAAGEETATEAANLYATEVVSRGAAEVRSDAEQRSAELQADLESIDERTVANEAELLRLGGELDDVDAPPGPGTRALLEGQIRRIDSALAEDARLRTQIVQDLPAAEAAALAGVSDYEFVRLARASDGDLMSDPALMALVAGLPLFLIGLGASVLWDQTVGVVRRPRDVRWATDAPVCAIGYSPDGEIGDPSRLTRLMARQQIPGSVWMVIPVGRNSEVVTLSSLLAEALGDRLESTADSVGPEAHQSEFDEQESQSGRQTVGARLAIEPADAVSERASAKRLTEASSRPQAAGELAPDHTFTAPGAAVSGAVVAIVTNGVRLPRLRRVVRNLELEGMPVEAVVIFGLER